MDQLSRNELRTLRALSHRRVRQRRGQVLVEGFRALGQAREAGVGIEFVALTPEAAGSPEGVELVARAAREGLPVRALEPHLCAEICATVTPPGVVALVRWSPLHRPDPDDLAQRLRSGAVHSVLALDAVADPGNAGTLVRTARAFGVTGIVFGRGAVDPTSPKVIRSSAGTILAVPCLAYGVDLPAFLEHLPRPEWSILRAETAGGDHRPAVATGGKWILLLGNEASGVSPGLREWGQAVSLPLAGGVESLNVAVAGGILLHVLTEGQKS